MSTKYLSSIAVSAVLIGVLTIAGCGKTEGGAASANGGTTDSVSGNINLDGSSTVYPILEAMAEEFMGTNTGANITVAVSGTGGGFKKFLGGEIDMVNASRPISEKELEQAAEKKIEFLEVPIAFDGLTVVVNPKNTWCDDLTVEELKKIWEPNSKINNWNQVRPTFPDKPLKLYGAGTDSGTFDYFTLAINGEEKASRTDYQSSEDDNVLVQGVAGDEAALGYFGYAYYEQNKEKLKALKIGGVAPTRESVADGSYQPLARPLFVYLNKGKLNPLTTAFLEYILSNGPIIESTGYIPFPADLTDMVKAHVKEGKTGSKFHGAAVGLGVKELLSAESN